MESVSYTIKGSTAKYSTHLSHREFACGCNHTDCVMQLARYDLLHAFDMTRIQYGEPITITSGFRCQRHNRDIGGVDNSMHKIGAGVDFWSRDLGALEVACQDHFDVVIRYKNYIHCQMNLAQFPEEDFISWQYTKKD